MKLQKFCGCFPSSNPRLVRTPTDAPIEATPAELQVIRDQLRPVEELLGKLFGPLVYSRSAKSMEIRAAAADVICEHLTALSTSGQSRSVLSSRGSQTQRKAKLTACATR